MDRGPRKSREAHTGQGSQGRARGTDTDKTTINGHSQSFRKILRVVRENWKI